MITKEISAEEFEKFASNNRLYNFYQTKEWKELKEKQGTNTLLIGCYENKKLCAASLLVIFPFLKLFKFAYFPRGFLVNFQDYDLLEKVTLSIKEYLKRNKFAFFRIDPAITLNRIQTDTTVVLDKSGKQIFDSLNKLGYRHHGYNIGFETFQARFNHVIYLNDTYEETSARFSKSTRKNIETSYNKGVVVKRGEVSDLKEAYDLFELTADRKNFHSYSYDFYKNMMETYKDKVTLYMAYIEPQKYKENYENLLINEKQKLHDIQEKKKHDNIGKKLIQQEELSERMIVKYQGEIEKAQKLGKDPILISSLLSIESGSEYISFISGMKSNYRDFYPKYAMYNKHINDAINKNLKVVNFFGVKGIFDPKDKDYGIYEIKKSFGGETLEYIGQFDFPINKFLYNLNKRR